MPSCGYACRDGIARVATRISASAYPGDDNCLMDGPTVTRVLVDRRGEDRDCKSAPIRSIAERYKLRASPAIASLPERPSRRGS